MAERLTTDQRVHQQGRDLENHSKTISVVVDRLGQVEEAQRERLLKEAREEEREKAFKADFARFEKNLGDLALKADVTRLEKKVEGITSAFWRMFWIVFTAVCGAFVVWMLRGGGMMPT